MKKLLVYMLAVQKLVQSHVRRMCLRGCAIFFHKCKPIPDPLGAILGDKILSICVLANANFVKVRKGIAPNDMRIVVVIN